MEVVGGGVEHAGAAMPGLGKAVCGGKAEGRGRVETLALRYIDGTRQSCQTL